VQISITQSRNHNTTTTNNNNRQQQQQPPRTTTTAKNNKNNSLLFSALDALGIRLLAVLLSIRIAPIIDSDLCGRS
jgi:hypothetical protein